MNPVDADTHYEILEVSANASFADIRKAYKEILSIYDTDSLSTYSLFTPQERKKILAQAEAAFRILGDADKRRAYDAELLSSGKLLPEMLTPNKAKEPVPVFHTELPWGTGQADRRIKEKLNEKRFRARVEDLYAKQVISGQDLKSLREAADIELLDLFDALRISVNILEAIEGNDRHKLPSPIYLKGFLKSYAQFLGLAPERIIAGYMAYLSPL